MRWGARLRARARMNGDRKGIRRMPHHGFGMAEGNLEYRMLRRIERRTGLAQTTQGARAGMRGRRAGPIVQAALIAPTVADDAGRQRIGNGEARRPAGGNRRQHLHRQSEQDQGQEFL